MKKILSIVLVFWVLVSSMTIGIGTHFCGNDLKSIALFGKAEPCSHAQSESDELPSCHSHQDSEENTSDCCKDKWLQLETLEIETTLSQVSFNLPQLDEDSAPDVIEEIYVITPLFSGPTHYLNYKPPLLAQDFAVFHQQFII